MHMSHFGPNRQAQKAEGAHLRLGRDPQRQPPCNRSSYEEYE
jgi:hypothetical protein